MSEAVTPSSKNTWGFIRDAMPGVDILRRGRSVIIKIRDEKLYIPPYPEIESVPFIRENNLIIPRGISDDWVAQWKANGSNIRVISINNVLLAFTRGGYLLDWKPYQSIINSDINDYLIAATGGGRFVLFGELVGAKSLVRLCVDEWRDYLHGELGYILFDVYDRERDLFIDLKEVEEIANKHSLLFPPTEWSIDYVRLNELLNRFMGICNGEMWEGFVFKNKERGKPFEVREKTKKLRLDEIREFAERIYRNRLGDSVAWRIFEAIRKFIIEGYLDPPITVDEAKSEVFSVRNEILDMIERAGIRAEREELGKKLRGKLKELIEELLSDEVKRDKAYRKAGNKAIKIFIRLYVWSQ